MSKGPVALCPRTIHCGSHNSEDGSLQGCGDQDFLARPAQVFGLGRILVVTDALPHLLEDSAGPRCRPGRWSPVRVACTSLSILRSLRGSSVVRYVPPERLTDSHYPAGEVSKHCTGEARRRLSHVVFHGFATSRAG